MKYNTDSCAVELSVRELCEWALSSGDLGGVGAGAAALTEGREIHKRLQKEAGGFYNPEVTLTNTVSLNGVYYTVSGRADGVIREADGFLCVDEIKCVRGFEFFAPPKAHFLAQMKCYAYFLCVRDGLESIRGRLTYYNVDNKNIKYFNYRLRTEELKAFYLDLLSKIEWRARAEIERTVSALPSAAAARFPYPELREGQEIMIKECYAAIKRGKRAFIEAPTGTGKTVSSLYPAVRALGEGHIDKIFYLTAKASVRREAYMAAGKLFEGGARLRTVVITAKEQVCPMKCEAAMSGARNMCDAASCPYARGYYDRVGEAIRELITEKNGYPRALICKTAEKYSVCPYELSLDLSELCDVIICDYNYAFDPCVYFRRYFSELGRNEGYAFLIDEAHNLADRARDMYSAVVKRSELYELRRTVGALKSETKSIIVKSVSCPTADIIGLLEL